MATLEAGTNSTYSGYSDGTLLAAFGSFTGTLGGATVNVVATDSTAPDVIAVYTAAGSFSAVNGKPLEIDGTFYAQASCVDLSFAIYSTYTATGFSFVNTTVYAVDFAVYAGPTYVGVSTGAGGASSVPISFSSSGRAAGDRMFIAVMTANQVVPALTGWTVVTPDSGDPFRGTAGAAGGVRCTVLTKVSDGTEGTVTVGDSGDVQYVAGIVVRGDSGADVDTGVSIGGNAAASTSGSFTGVTTDSDSQLILTFVTTDRDASGASWSSQANANLGNLTERFDNGTATNTGGGVAIYTGEKLVAGATGTTTATQAASAAYCWITLAVKNGVGIQTLNPPLLTNSVTFYAADVTRGAVSVSPGLLTNAQTFYGPTVAQGQSLLPNVVNNGQTFYDAAVSRGPVALLSSLLPNAQTFFSPAISVGEVRLLPPLVTSAQAFFAPTVTAGAENLSPSLLTNVQAFYGPTISVGGVALLPSPLVNAQAFYEPTVAAGLVTLEPPLISNDQVFYDPIVTIEGGPQFLLPELVANDNEFFGATITNDQAGPVDYLNPLADWVPPKRDDGARRDIEALFEAPNQPVPEVLTKPEPETPKAIPSETFERLASLEGRLSAVAARKQADRLLRKAIREQEDEEAVMLLLAA